MSLEIAWKQNILVTDFHLLKSLLVVFGFGSQAFICGFSRQNIFSVHIPPPLTQQMMKGVAILLLFSQITHSSPEFSKLVCFEFNLITMWINPVIFTDCLKTP